MIKWFLFEIEKNSKEPTHLNTTATLFLSFKNQELHFLAFKVDTSPKA